MESTDMFGQTTQVRVERVIPFGVSLRLDDVRDWIEDVIPEAPQSGA